MLTILLAEKPIDDLGIERHNTVYARKCIMYSVKSIVAQKVMETRSYMCQSAEEPSTEWLVVKGHANTDIGRSTG